VIIYAEANFALEIALQGPKPGAEARAAAEILTAAEERRLQLVIPEFALAEAFSKVAYRHVDGERARRGLHGEMKRLQAVVGLHAETSFEIEPDLAQLAARKTMEMNRLLEVTARLAKAGELISPDYQFLGESAFIWASGLSEKDAIIFRAVLIHLGQRQDEPHKCFVTRDRKAFDTPQVRETLRSHNCDFRSSFVAALDWVSNPDGGEA